VEEDNNLRKIDFEYGEEDSYSYNKIKKEYLKKTIKFFPFLSGLLIITAIYFTLIYPILLIPEDGITITWLTPYSFNLTINWTVFSLSAFLFFYLIKILIMRITPFLKEQIRNDINALGFIIKEKRKSVIFFVILNSISVLLLLLIELDIIYFNTLALNTLFKGFLITYLFLSMLIPILLRFSYDGLSVTLKDKYNVSIKPYYKIRRVKTKDSQLIGIFITSNKIASKFNKNKKSLYTQIAKSRWLPRKRKSIISKYRLSPFLRFHEFSTPVNFQKQFLNLALALQDWDLHLEKINSF